MRYTSDVTTSYAVTSYYEVLTSVDAHSDICVMLMHTMTSYDAAVSVPLPHSPGGHVVLTTTDGLTLVTLVFFM